MIVSNRSMTEIDVTQMNTMREVGIGTCKIFGSFAGQSGGYRYIGFSKKDMYNQIQRQRRIGNGDAESSLQYLEEQSKSDYAMYWRHTVDEECKLQQLFWADGCRIFDYSIFGDVLAFDATYGRNKYKFPVVISGVNHHKQTTVFQKVMYADVEIDDFNMMWEELIAKHALHNNRVMLLQYILELFSKNSVKFIGSCKIKDNFFPTNLKSCHIQDWEAL
ncbi:hypothetical protein Lal_00019211 [Lupinus albus]|nr:hypothetical protein Lal_00019211 [Lupinus albus]